MTRSLVLSYRSTPNSLPPSLELAGYRVFEALAISEVLHLCEHESIDCVVILQMLRTKRLRYAVACSDF